MAHSYGPDAGPFCNTVGIGIVTIRCSGMLRLRVLRGWTASLRTGVLIREAVPVARPSVVRRTGSSVADPEDFSTSRSNHWREEFDGQANSGGNSWSDAGPDFRHIRRIRSDRCESFGRRDVTSGPNVDRGVPARRSVSNADASGMQRAPAPAHQIWNSLRLSHPTSPVPRPDGGCKQ
jgi:hypothetical protein